MTQINFYLYFRECLKLYDKVTMPVAEKHGLGYMEFVTLIFLANNKEYNKASDIVTLLGIAKSHVSSTLDQLEKKNLIERVKDESDKRSSIIRIKENAKEIINDGRKAQEEYWKMVVKDIDEEELRKLNETLMKIEKNVKEKI